MARHPFGPGGEGGRDDAIYSASGCLGVRESVGKGVKLAYLLWSRSVMEFFQKKRRQTHPNTGCVDNWIIGQERLKQAKRKVICRVVCFSFFEASLVQKDKDQSFCSCSLCQLALGKP